MGETKPNINATSSVTNFLVKSISR